jgi:hypothetical protein
VQLSHDWCCEAKKAGYKKDTPDKQLCLSGVRLKNQVYFFSIGQLLKPNSGYIGQNLKIPVANGMMPIQPHGAKIPVAANVIRMTPAIIRNALSVLPTFTFIVCSV